MNIERSELVVIMIFLLCISCTGRNERAMGRGSRADALGADKTNVGPVDISLLQGVWLGDESDPSAAFNIIGDSLYYTDEQDAPYFVAIEGKTFILRRDDVSMSFAFKRLTKDSLVLFDPILGEDVKFFKGRE